MINKRKGKNYRGFTLIEVIITLVILIIIGLITFPNYRKYQTTSELKGISDNITHMLKLAKENSRAVEGSRVRFTRGSINTGTNGFTTFKEMDVQNLNGTSIRKLSIPEQISISGIPSVDYFDFTQNGTVDTDMIITVQSSGTKLEGIINISHETGSIDLTFKEREQ